MEETTHDSSSSSRKSEEKCPPAGGIKMKIGGFKTGHCYHKPSDAAIQQEPSGVNSGVWLPLLQDCWQFQTQRVGQARAKFYGHSLINALT